MRPLWLITALFMLLGVVSVCRTPETPLTAGCTRLASGLEHCPRPVPDP